MKHKALRLFAPLKINLFLHVESVRDDGYHNLISLMASVAIGDTLTLHKGTQENISLLVKGPYRDALQASTDADNNLILQDVPNTPNLSLIHISEPTRPY